MAPARNDLLNHHIKAGSSCCPDLMSHLPFPGSFSSHHLKDVSFSLLFGSVSPLDEKPKRQGTRLWSSACLQDTGKCQAHSKGSKIFVDWMNQKQCNTLSTLPSSTTKWELNLGTRVQAVLHGSRNGGGLSPYKQRKLTGSILTMWTRLTSSVIGHVDSLCLWQNVMMRSLQLRSLPPPNISRLQMKGDSTKYLNSTPQNYQGHEKQEQSEKLP